VVVVAARVRRASWAPSAGILLAFVVAMALVALAVAAVTTAVAQPAFATLFAAVAVGVVVVSAVYGAAGWALVREVRSTGRH
jgi:biotin transporter BioY